MSKLARGMQALSRSLIEKRDRERQSISYKLHEEVAQVLALIVRLLDKTLASSQNKNYLLLEQALEQAKVQVRDLLDCIRECSYDLYPRMLDILGLLPTLRWYFERYSQRTKIKVDFHNSGLKRPLDREISIAVFRILEEALASISCHVTVSEIRVILRVTSTTLRLRIDDHGKGFDQSALNADILTDLLEMRERVLMLGGKLKIRSAPGTGTAV